MDSLTGKMAMLYTKQASRCQLQLALLAAARCKQLHGIKPVTD
jgi:hypothetical protein